MPSIFFRDLYLRKPLHDIRDFLEILREKKKRIEKTKNSHEALRFFTSAGTEKKHERYKIKDFCFRTLFHKHLSTYFKVIFNATLSYPGGRGCIDLSLAYSSFIRKSLFNHLLNQNPLPQAWN